MDVNITFFIQVLNLFICYKVLSFLLFKPVVAAIKQKRDAQVAMTNAIKQKEKQLLILETKKETELAQFQTRIQHDYPFTPKITPHIEQLVEITIEEKSTTEKKDLLEKTVDLLTKKVPHAL